jgi:MSHA biogenesis protein MshL
MNASRRTPSLRAAAPGQALRRPRLRAAASASALACGLALLAPSAGWAQATGTTATPASGAAPAPATAATHGATPAAPRDRFDLALVNAPAQQAFLQLAQGSGYSVVVSPEVTGNVSVTLKNTTVMDAMEVLRELYGYGYRVKGNRILVLPNTVQTRIYRISYLSGRRQGVSDIRVTSSSITQSGSQPQAPGQGGLPGSGGGNGGNASRSEENAHVRTTSDADFWRDVLASLQALVGTQQGRSVVLNPSAGVIVIKATPGELQHVEHYLQQVQIAVERQVMIEAKILEVELNSDSQAGVNWTAFASNLFGNNQRASVGMVQPGATLSPTGTISDGVNTAVAGANMAAGALSRGFYGLAFQAANFAAMLNFLQTQGNVSVLSSPRIATVNNQKAVLKVGTDEMFVTGIASTTTTSGTNTTSTPSVSLQPFFSGIALDVTPQIDDSGQVILHVHPTVSQVAEKTKNIDLGALGAYRLPLATSTVNETDSIVRVRDGSIVAIGGLMLQRQADGTSSVPVLGSMPVIGGLFRNKSTGLQKRELVILLKPTVIRADGHWPDPGELARQTLEPAPAPSPLPAAAPAER